MGHNVFGVYIGVPFCMETTKYPQPIGLRLRSLPTETHHPYQKQDTKDLGFGVKGYKVLEIDI